MRPIGSLDRGVARLREPRRLTAAGTRHVRCLARLQPTPLRPPLKAPHRGRDLPQACDHDPLEILTPPCRHSSTRRSSSPPMPTSTSIDVTSLRSASAGSAARTTSCSSLFPFPALTPAQTTPTTSPTPTSSRQPGDVGTPVLSRRSYFRRRARRRTSTPNPVARRSRQALAHGRRNESQQAPARARPPLLLPLAERHRAWSLAGPSSLGLRSAGAEQKGAARSASAAARPSRNCRPGRAARLRRCGCSRQRRRMYRVADFRIACGSGRIAATAEQSCGVAQEQHSSPATPQY